MKAISGPLQTWLASNQSLVMADLYTITLASGSILRYTDFDIDLAWGGNTFLSSGPPLKRSKTRIVIGLEVDTLDVEMYPRPTDLLNGLAMTAAVSAGAFDGATLTLERAYLDPSTGVPSVVGTLIMFSGDFADTEVSRTLIKCRINSDVAQLNILLPRNIYQSGCMHVLYDSDCQAARVATALVAGYGTTASQIVTGSLVADNFFTRGYVTFTSGALNGISKTVKSYVGGAFQLISPLPVAPTSGDTFNAFPGCDHSQATCLNKFNNIIHFRAMPYIPVPETALQ